MWTPLLLLLFIGDSFFIYADDFSGGEMKMTKTIIEREVSYFEERSYDDVKVAPNSGLFRCSDKNGIN